MRVAGVYFYRKVPHSDPVPGRAPDPARGPKRRPGPNCRLGHTPDVDRMSSGNPERAAHYIVSGDTHLLSLRTHAGIPAITGRAFLGLPEKD